MTEQRKNGEYHRADPAWRRKMQLFLGVSVVVGIAALVALQMWMSRSIGSDPEANQHVLSRVLAVVCLGLGLAALAFSVWMFRLAAATRADRRWPPSNMRTSSDVKIRYLTSADAMVMQMKAGAFALVVVAAVLLAWGAWLLRSA